MKRMHNLYNNILDLENINYVFNKICCHVKNKQKKEILKQYKCMYISNVYNILKNSTKTYSLSISLLTNMFIYFYFIV